MAPPSEFDLNHRAPFSYYFSQLESTEPQTGVIGEDQAEPGTVFVLDHPRPLERLIIAEVVDPETRYQKSGSIRELKQKGSVCGIPCTLFAQRLWSGDRRDLPALMVCTARMLPAYRNSLPAEAHPRFDVESGFLKSILVHFMIKKAPRGRQCPLAPPDRSHRPSPLSGAPPMKRQCVKREEKVVLPKQEEAPRSPAPAPRSPPAARLEAPALTDPPTPSQAFQLPTRTRPASLKDDGSELSPQEDPMPLVGIVPIDESVRSARPHTYPLFGTVQSYIKQALALSVGFLRICKADESLEAGSFALHAAQWLRDPFQRDLAEVAASIRMFEVYRSFGRGDNPVTSLELPKDSPFHPLVSAALCWTSLIEGRQGEGEGHLAAALSALDPHRYPKVYAHAAVLLVECQAVFGIALPERLEWDVMSREITPEDPFDQGLSFALMYRAIRGGTIGDFVRPWRTLCANRSCTPDRKFLLATLGGLAHTVSPRHVPRSDLESLWGESFPVLTELFASIQSTEKAGDRLECPQWVRRQCCGLLPPALLLHASVKDPHHRLPAFISALSAARPHSGSFKAEEASVCLPALALQAVTPAPTPHSPPLNGTKSAPTHIKLNCDEEVDAPGSPSDSTGECESRSHSGDGSSSSYCGSSYSSSSSTTPHSPSPSSPASPEEVAVTFAQGGRGAEPEPLPEPCWEQNMELSGEGWDIGVSFC